MKFVDEFRDPDAAHQCAEAIRALVTRPWSIMEICGGQTHAIVRHGIDRMLPAGVSLLHGPGCPVCVTPGGTIDAAIAIASSSGAILCSFGDMLRVPGQDGSLLSARTEGADVRVVYSPLDALEIARAKPDKDIVFFAIGFETTAPATALALLQAEREKLDNFSVLVSHFLVPPAMEALLADPTNQVDGFLAAGHVCTITGIREYEPIARRFATPIVVTGFEPLDLLQGIYLCLRQLEAGIAMVENQYVRSVRPGGNRAATTAVERVFEVRSQAWRGMDELDASGLGLRPDYVHFDALVRFEGIAARPERPGVCISGEILRGARKPGDCPAFSAACTPDHPLGATMVSSEGPCAAYYRYRRPLAGQDRAA